MGSIKKTIVLEDGIVESDDKFKVVRYGSYERVVQKGHDIIIIAYNKGGGLVPFALRLPHQVYMRNLEEILEKEGDIKGFMIIPAKADSYIPLAKVETEFIPNEIDEIHKKFNVDQKAVIESYEKELKELANRKDDEINALEEERWKQIDEIEERLAKEGEQDAE